ncbi:MAG: branched-chain amino acid ABC transporter permease [Alphaproteobacteria bacterium]|nr:branched-chain amino acid ABC transporter permease [Alphaproteobacteria bacterium]
MTAEIQPARRGVFRREDVAALAVFLLLAAIPLATSGYVVYILPQYMLLGVLAMSLALLWGHGGIVSFGQAAFFAIGAYAMGLVMKHLTGMAINSAYVGILVGTVGGGVTALLIGYFLFSAGVRAAYFVVATLALSIVVEQTVKSFSDITGGWNGLYVDRMTVTLGSWLELSLFDDAPIYYVVLAVVVPVYVIATALMRGRFGKIVVGIRENEDRMTALGFNVPMYKTLVFGLSGLLAGVAGSFYATHAQFAHPVNAGVLFSTQVVIWVAIGGRHSLLGSFVGAIVVASLSNYLSSIEEIQNYWPLVMGLIFIAVIVLFRGGLAGLVEKLAGKGAHGRAAGH